MTTFTWYRSGNTYRPHAAPWVLDTITNGQGVQQADITPDGLGTWPVKLTLKQFVPQEALEYRIFTHLYRGVVDQNGKVDVSGVCFLPGWQNLWQTPNPYGDAYQAEYGQLGVAANSGGTWQGSPSPGRLWEGNSREVSFPNLTDNGDWASFYWLHRGQTLLGAGMILRLASFLVPDGYVLPDPWPAAPPPPPEPPPSLLLKLLFDNFQDSSSWHRTIINNGVTLNAGSAVFDGASYLGFDASGAEFAIDGDFRIACLFIASVGGLEGGSQRRLVSLGGYGANNSPALFIDHQTGAIALVNEWKGVLHTGAINVVTGQPVLVEWVRQGGQNTLLVNGQPDGTFTDARTWAGEAQAAIGKLAASNVGHFSGMIDEITIET